MNISTLGATSSLILAAYNPDLIGAGFLRIALVLALHGFSFGLNMLQAAFTGFCPAAMLFQRLGLPGGCKRDEQ